MVDNHRAADYGGVGTHPVGGALCLSDGRRGGLPSVPLDSAAFLQGILRNFQENTLDIFVFPCYTLYKNLSYGVDKKRRSPGGAGAVGSEGSGVASRKRKAEPYRARFRAASPGCRSLIAGSGCRQRGARMAYRCLSFAVENPDGIIDTEAEYTVSICLRGGRAATGIARADLERERYGKKAGKRRRAGTVPLS